MADHHARLRDEHARSHAHLSRYRDSNPHVFDDPDTYIDAHGKMTEAQLHDLEQAGLYDPEHFRKLSGGRGPTASEIHDHHLAARAHGGYGVRSAERLINDVHAQLHGGQARRAGWPLSFHEVMRPPAAATASDDDPPSR